MDNPQTLFLMHIIDGYSFRNTISIFKSETDFVTLLLSEKHIEISFQNSIGCAIHKILMNTVEFTRYDYNIRGEDGNLIKEYPITLDTNEIYNTTKNIGKRDGIRLYWLPGDNKLNVQQMKVGTRDPGRAGASFVKILPKEHIKYTVDSSFYDPDPNIRVQAKDFTDLCIRATSSKCAFLEIVGHKAGVTINGIFPNQTLAFVEVFKSQTNIPKTMGIATNIDQIDNLIDNLRIRNYNTPNVQNNLCLNVIKNEDLMTINIPLQMVKSLSKIHNISPNGALLRFSFAAGKPTKIESQIGIYGTYEIYIKKPSQ